VTTPAIDAHSGEIRPASVFVAVLGASSYDRRKSLWDTFACATPGQTQVDWLTGIGRALKFIGGVTVPAAATGVWAGKTNQIAVRVASTWEYYVPKIGWLCFIDDEAVLSAYKAARWSTGIAI